MIAGKHLSIAQILVCLTAAGASVGCGAAGAGGRPTAFAAGDVAPVRVGQTRVIGARVNPMVPVRLATEGSDITATFALPGREQVVTRLDPASLDLLSREQFARAAAPPAPATGATRVALDGGRFLVCWTHENADEGRQVLAQMWAADGSKRGEPVVISPPDVDVLGAPRAATTDGRHVVVIFAATSGTTFELRAVSLEDGERSVDSYPVAAR